MATENLTRRCSDCHWFLPLDCFYPYQRRGRTYLSSRCKPCAKLASHTNYHSRRTEALKVKLEWRLANKPKIAETNRLYRKNNDQAVRERKSKYYKKPEVRTRYRERNRIARHADPERSNAYSRKWRKSNPETRRASVNRNKLKRRDVVGTCSPIQWIAKCEYFGWRCYLCGVSLTPKTTHMEHRKPLSRGGTAWPANTAPACGPCNLSKNNKTEAEYRALR